MTHHTSYLPVEVLDVPIDAVFQPDGALRENYRNAVANKVIRVIAGATKCHLIIDIKRPYVRPLAQPFLEAN